jgi:hypothetical protein
MTGYYYDWTERPGAKDRNYYLRSWAIAQGLLPSGRPQRVRIFNAMQRRITGATLDVPCQVIDSRPRRPANVDGNNPNTSNGSNNEARTGHQPGL